MEAYWEVRGWCVYRCIYYNEKDDYSKANRIIARIPDIDDYYLFIKYN